MIVMARSTGPQIQEFLKSPMEEAALPVAMAVHTQVGQKPFSEARLLLYWHLVCGTATGETGASQTLRHHHYRNRCLMAGTGSRLRFSPLSHVWKRGYGGKKVGSHSRSQGRMAYRRLCPRWFVYRKTRCLRHCEAATGRVPELVFGKPSHPTCRLRPHRRLRSLLGGFARS